MFPDLFPVKFNCKSEILVIVAAVISTGSKPTTSKQSRINLSTYS